MFSQANGEILGEQFCRFYFFDGRQTTQALTDAGFKQGYQIIDGKFLVSYK
ncbi:MAG: hypothetical protein F6K54_07135 [Okeania sp. SIO3B5]|uniref:hypothetical protein n=1 Tax=Okeania sp. SIO3B5 TaxID=2607811 RepID=UPI0013FFB9B7|nr:hypothetical protein [Okeania sp. SIO3B5]NEO52875.1 hypothetical protein [Okeania sp. SIO3B5]